MGLAPIFCLRSEGLSALERIVEESLQGLGYELVHLERGPRGLVRVFMDRSGGADPASADGRITLDDCEQASNQLSRVLTVEGIPYERLEISSPGLDRVLKKPADFRRFAGQEATVSLRAPLNGRRRFVGVLRGADDAQLDLEVEGALHSIRLEDVERARLVPKFELRSEKR
jgi:ribosome maturation factor RimP